ncbi:carboxymuconolactone decarboxylase family protein [Vibrio crassostreae]|uniref:carboxymuconolactone decarboxylase family protein n=1 Tax=Vibrio crassostreae TaxID=246167 RepID=UPI00200A59E4|nr:carboxymuconolactone decarboxylase family protein [Vibrio crassostreae]UPR31669.1 carboxymuconolactone decarboxylase family protein [Vibrio crassostreae]
MNTSRFKKGLELLKQIDGEAGQNVIESLQDISPDLAKYTIEYPFGDIYAPQLKVHLNAALNVGCSEEEIKEVIIQMSGYAGFPAALNGMFAFKEVLAERTAKHDSEPDA